MSHGNAMSRGMSCLMECHVSWNVMSHGNAMTCLAEIIISTETWAFNTQNISCCHAWKTEVIIERYCIYIELPLSEWC